MSTPDFTPDHIIALKRYSEQMGLAEKGLADRNKARSEYEDSLKQAQQSAGAYVPLQIPEQRRASRGEALAMVLADLGRELTSTVPASQRQQLPSGLSVYRQLSQEDQDRALRDAQIKHQDALAKLQAKANADRIALEGAAQKYGFTSNEYAQAQENLRFTQSQMTQQAQFNRSIGLQEKQFEFDKQKWADSLGLDLKQFEEVQRHNKEIETPEVIRNIRGLMSVGFSEKEATDIYLAPQMKAVLDYERTKEYNKLLPVSVEVKNLLDKWALDRKEAIARINETNAAAASHNRANRGTPEDPRLYNLNQQQQKDADKDYNDADSRIKASQAEIKKIINGIGSYANIDDGAKQKLLDYYAGVISTDSQIKAAAKDRRDTLILDPYSIKR